MKAFAFLLLFNTAAFAQQTMTETQRIVADAYTACLPHRTSVGTFLGGKNVGWVVGWEAGFESCAATEQQWEQVQQQLAKGNQ